MFRQAPGELFDVPTYTSNSLKNELEAVERRFNPDKEDFTKLPTLSFKGFLLIKHLMPE